MAFTAFYTNTNALYQPVPAAAPGAIGYVVRLNGANFTGANAGAEATAQAVGMISYIPDVSHFFVTQDGYVTNIAVAPAEGGAFAVGTTYYLSTTTGLLTAIKPTTVGQAILALFRPDTPTSGYFQAVQPEIIKANTLFNWTTISANQTLAINQGYFVNGGGALNDLKLPLAMGTSDSIELWDIGGNGFTITQRTAPDQSIIAGT
jgi:hypothetical protein